MFTLRTRRIPSEVSTEIYCMPYRCPVQLWRGHSGRLPRRRPIKTQQRPWLRSNSQKKPSSRTCGAYASLHQKKFWGCVLLHPKSLHGIFPLLPPYCRLVLCARNRQGITIPQWCYVAYLGELRPFQTSHWAAFFCSEKILHWFAAAAILHRR
jgi:hypothetical protein